MKIKTIQPRGLISATIVPPGSKSITNRALILAALCPEKTILDGALDSEDTMIMFSALKQLGLECRHDVQNRTIEIIGQKNGFSARKADIYVGNSGTTARFLTAILSFSHGEYRIHGKPRMHQRPIRDLIDSLRDLGGNIHCENDNDCPPVIIGPFDRDKITNDYSETTVSGSVSSQFLSAILMAAPLAVCKKGVNVPVAENLVSKPYIEMTLKIMESFGVVPRIHGDFKKFEFDIHNVYRSPKHYVVEPDASAASYFFAAAAVCGGSVRISGLSRNSLQGDIAFVDCLEKMGCNVQWANDSIMVERLVDEPLRGVSVDMNSYSDTAQTLAAVALFADRPTEIVNIEHVRYKETDRIADLATELRRFGAEVEERQDGLKIFPPQNLIPACVETYDDHRMAMSFAVVGLRLPGVEIKNPDCTKKTFPGFFEVLERL